MLLTEGTGVASTVSNVNVTIWSPESSLSMSFDFVELVALFSGKVRIGTAGLRFLSKSFVTFFLSPAWSLGASKIASVSERSPKVWSVGTTCAKRSFSVSSW